jgi:hypothetical protein
MCKSTFGHGLLVAFCAYHAIYSGLFLFGVLSEKEKSVGTSSAAAGAVKVKFK